MDIAAHTLALREERMNVINQLNAKLDDTAGRERSEEEKAVIARLDARIDEIDAEVRDAVRRHQRELDAAAIREANIKLFGETKVERREQNEADAIRAWLRGESGKGGFEIRGWYNAYKEVQAIRAGASPEELRVMNYQTSSGSLVVPTTMARTLYEYMEASIAGFRMGFDVLATEDGGPIQLPKLAAHAIAVGTIPQGTSIGGTDPTFGRVQLDAYKYGQLVAVSSELLDDAGFDIGTWLAKDLGRAVGRIVDTALIVGTGTSEPKGYSILNGSGTNAPVTTGGSLIAPTYEKWVDTVYSINDEYRQLGAAWLMKDSTAGTIRKLRDGAGGTVGAVLWEPSLTAGLKNGQPDRFLGYPVYVDTNCAAQGSNATLATFGWPAEYAFRTVGSPVIERDDSVYFATDQSALRIKWRVDGDHRDPGAVNNLVQNV